MMTHKVQVTVGSLADMGKRFVGAWHRAEAGYTVDETHITFLDVQTMLDTLSPRRLELLRHVRQARSALGRIAGQRVACSGLKRCAACHQGSNPANAAHLAIAIARDKAGAAKTRPLIAV